MSSGIDSALAPAEQSARSVSFGGRLHRRVTERRSQLVLGLDPDPCVRPRAIERVSGTGASLDPPADRLARAVRGLLPASAPRSAAPGWTLTW
jgi:hypothetical protein